MTRPPREAVATLEKELRIIAKALGKTKPCEYPTTKLARAACEFVGEWQEIQRARAALLTTYPPEDVR